MHRNSNAYMTHRCEIVKIGVNNDLGMEIVL